MRKLLIKKLTDNAIAPNKKLEDDEGYDLYSNETIKLNHGVTKVHTGIIAWTVNTLNCDTKYWLKIEGRSGLASKGIFPIGGIVDSSYRGEIIVILVNVSGEEYEVKEGDKIAQLVIHEHRDFFVQETTDVQETERGVNGFGSSGR